MTKKDYIKFASIFKDSRENIPNEASKNEVINYLEDSITIYLRHENKLFDGLKFRIASKRDGF
jgi:hypothetical protein